MQATSSTQSWAVKAALTTKELDTISAIGEVFKKKKNFGAGPDKKDEAPILPRQ